MVTSPLIVTLLTEDKSEQSFDALKSLLHKLVHRYQDDGRTERVRVEPGDAASRKLVIAHGWRGNAQQRVELVRFLATRLSQPGNAVVFHHDGDVPWQERELGQLRAQVTVELPQFR